MVQYLHITKKKKKILRRLTGAAAYFVCGTHGENKPSKRLSAPSAPSAPDVLLYQQVPGSNRAHTNFAKELPVLSAHPSPDSNDDAAQRDE